MKKQKLNLYVWTDFCPDYTSGLAFAIAESEAQARSLITIDTGDAPMEPEDIDKKYGLTGSCIGCRRVTWLCRRDRKCGKYNRKPKAGYIARPTGYAKPGSICERGEVEK